ncbi:MAG: peptidoglycan editing factor PgeF [Clostridia bacterium]
MAINNVLGRDNPVKYLCSPKLNLFTELTHGFTLRKGGYSFGLKHELNLALHVNDRYEDVIKNRQLLASSLGFSANRIVTLNQVHSLNGLILSEEDAGKGAFDMQSSPGEYDYMITAALNIPLLIMTADCVPILIYDRKKKVIAAVHAGWKGTVQRILDVVIIAMQNNFGTMKEDLIVAIGPCIQQCCYEIGENVESIVKANFTCDEVKQLITKKNGEIFLNLQLANYFVLIELGLSSEQIDILDFCTSCNVDNFFSYRKENGKTGRMGAVIMLNSIA